MRPRSFTSPTTEFELLRSDTPVTVDGFALGEYTGIVRCRECLSEAKNVDEIPHDAGCSQRFVRSRWWAGHFQ